MKIVLHSNRQKTHIIILSGVLLLTVIAMSILFVPKSHAALVLGDPGAPSGSGGGGSGYHTSNGHGWKLYTIGGGGPAAFQDGSSWGSVSARCSAVGANKVWVYVIRNRGGSEKGYTFTNTYEYYSGEFNPDTNAGGAAYYPSKYWWIDRPGAGGDPYVYNESGNYDGVKRYGGSSGYGSADLVVKSVRDLYQKEGGDGNIWGWRVGWFCYNDIPPWSVSVISSADKSSAKPGDTITWTHTVKNDGPNSTSADVTYHYRNKQGLGDFDGPNDYILKKGSIKNATGSFKSTYGVTNDNVGKNLCRETNAAPRSSTNTGWIWTDPPACVFVPYNYSLNPLISGSPSVIDGEASIQLTASITSTGETKSKTTQWQATTFTVPPGFIVPTGGNSGLTPGSYYGYGTSIVKNGTNVFQIGVTDISINPQDVSGYLVGTKICYGLSLQPRSSSSNQWRHSEPFCVTVGKKPSVQVWGGDIRVGKGVTPANIVTSSSQKTVNGEIRTFGSWSEYGILSNGLISGVGSGSAYSGGTLSSNFCEVSLLSFTNAGSSNCSQGSVVGRYVSVYNAPNVAKAFPVTDSTPTYSGLDDAKARKVVTSSSDIILAGGMIEKGDWLVINAPDSTVTITGNIQYTGNNLQSIRDIPQLVIIANHINITGGVTQIDAWLITSGKDGIINTCSDYAVSAPLTVDRCSNQLTVNGPVVASTLYLRRTAGAGSGNAAGDPAEIFNLRPDAYLWSVARANEDGRIRSVYTKELPPRF